MPNFHDTAAEFDHNDITTFNNGLSYSNSASNLINAYIRSASKPVKHASEVSDYRGIQV